NLRYNLHPRWYLNSEIHIRRANGFSNWQQFVARPSVHFVLSKYADFSVGYSYILSYPYGNQPIPLTTPEHNIWEQAILAHKMGKVGFKHRYRFEQRFQGVRKQDGEGIYSIDGFELAERFRYRLTLIVPVALEGRWFVSLFDEVFVRQSNFVPSAFDQNWAYLGVGFKLNTRGTIKLGYLDAFIRKSDGVHFEHNPTVQFSIGYKLGKLPESVN
ncbi:MAG: DUF2490 domain-containing protein, partial [Flavobacteriales bacterium]|nr:DUF2490 domain-containing protein [Flavobacteriales bacterium]